MWRHRTLAELLIEEVPFRRMGIRGQEIWTGPTDRPRKPQKTRLRGVFADADATARRKVRRRAVKFGGPQRHHAINHRLTLWRVTELYGAQWRRRRRICREDGSSGVSSVCPWALSRFPDHECPYV